MELSYTQPIKFDFRPISGSILTFEFKLKKSKQRIKVGVCLNIYYKDPYLVGRVSLANSDIQSVYTSAEDAIHKLKFKTPEFNNCTQSYIFITMEPAGNFYEKVIIEDMQVSEMISILQPEKLQLHIATPDIQPQAQQPVHTQLQASVAIPNIQPKISQQVQSPMITYDIVHREPPSPPQTILTRTAPPEIVIERQKIDKIVIASTWNIKCGIALYTDDLLNALNKICPNSFMVNPMNNGSFEKDIDGKLTHIQHEFSIVPNIPDTKGKVIITWHTVPDNISRTIRAFESKLDIAAHIVPCEGASKYILTKKDVFIVSLGSTLMPHIKKEDARVLLNINTDKPIGFVFGFQSPAKNYLRLMRAAKNAGIHLIISGSMHNSGYESGVKDTDHTTILNRYLTDTEINLYSLASDILLFDYAEQAHYSSSSALHRTIGAGRPVVCGNIRHFSDIDGVPKFSDQKELEQCIKYALDNQESLGKLSLRYAEVTSWENVAKKHIEIYNKYVEICKDKYNETMQI